MQKNFVVLNLIKFNYFYIKIFFYASIFVNIFIFFY